MNYIRAATTTAQANSAMVVTPKTLNLGSMFESCTGFLKLKSVGVFEQGFA